MIMDTKGVHCVIIIMTVDVITSCGVVVIVAVDQLKVNNNK